MPFFASSDGVEVAAWDLGGDGPPLLFSHATGFHGKVWLPMSECLDAFHRYSLDERGHGDTRTPAGHHFDWHGFGLERPFGVGHSAGAAALLMAEAARPGTFRALYLWEPVVMPVDPPMGPQDNPLTERALKRRAVFPSREDAYANYASKPPFSQLHPDALRAYVDHGFADLPDGQVTLKCKPEDEALIYRMGSAHRAFSQFGEVRCPVVIACGVESDAFGPALIDLQAAALPRARTEPLPGLGHFGPLQDPEAVATAVRRAFGELR